MVAAAKVIQIEQHRSADVIQTLEALLSNARSGHLDGLLFVAKYRGHYETGAAGSYARLPDLAVNPVLTLLDRVRAEASR